MHISFAKKVYDRDINWELIITIKLMASVGFAKLLWIRVRIYSVVKAASPPKIKVLKF